MHLHHRLHALNNHFDGFLMPLLTQASFPGRSHEIVSTVKAHPSTLMTNPCITTQVVSSPTLQRCRYLQYGNLVVATTQFPIFSTCEYPSDCRLAWRASLYASVIFRFLLPLLSPSPSRCALYQPSRRCGRRRFAFRCSWILILHLFSSSWATQGIFGRCFLSCRSRSLRSCSAISAAVSSHLSALATGISLTPESSSA